ncbi:MAG: aspartyl/glutamyl-tRNA amidotransferase subunit A [Candidatus Portnoybacteria bacterium RIFCSPLOWO2_02_FULL_39_11]|uniref:Glutamyl-tRNA(Gln) amidotransferase subunit A n=1 Tax=Candidatus Portnoybacteria bacterium RIFCSPLOWO2_02_FULL_39_11 TaxID=1802001 RepID=A0A1G2FST5_9BACT|nr:MAG: aspartyl/glutamyl-tRNA amidotransferase subunit A [Candidatus Portnoybacteria bacterium RIFCSPLOWO2_02_FULL_39_11]
MDLSNLTIKQAHESLKTKQFSATELARAYFDRIKDKDEEIHAYLSVTEKLALEEAAKVDAKIADGSEFGLLEGVPCAIKDNILLEGAKCTAGSKILANYAAPYDATVIRKLKKAGAIFLGKTNMDEFAMGSSTENSVFGPTKNPHDLERVPGGSSGGSAAAVAAGECVYALGSDTGGSIRQPASFCGVVGLKPTYGAVSRYGVMAMASSLDQIGPLAKTVEDCKTVFDAIKGKDARDATSASPTTDYRPPTTDKLKIGLPEEYFAKGLDPEVEKLVKGAIGKLAKQGARVEEISLPHSEYALACYYIIMASEVSANLARFDGIKYGESSINNKQLTTNNLLDVYLTSRGQYLGAEVRRRIMLGTYSLSSGYYDAYYLRAQKVRAKISQDFKQAFAKVDLIMTPVAPTTAFKIGEKIDDPVTMYLSDIYTVPVNMAGAPALAMPVGKIGKLPVGLQIIGPHFSEELIFQAAQTIEDMLE